MISVLVTATIVLLVFLWGVSVYTQLVGMRRQVVIAWKLLNAQLVRRQDLSSNLAHEELGAAESTIEEAARSYNEIAGKYNAALKVFPHNLAAAVGSFKPAELFDIAARRSRAS